MKLHEKRIHYENQFKKTGSNAKLVWNVVNSLIKKTNTKREITSIIHDGKSVSDKSEICEAFNSHFANVGEWVQKTMKQGVHGQDNISNYVKRVGNDMKFHPVSELHICNIVAKLKPKNKFWS